MTSFGKRFHYHETATNITTNLQSVFLHDYSYGYGHIKEYDNPESSFDNDKVNDLASNMEETSDIEVEEEDDDEANEDIIHSDLTSLSLSIQAVITSPPEGIASPPSPEQPSEYRLALFQQLGLLNTNTTVAPQVQPPPIFAARVALSLLLSSSTYTPLVIPMQ